MKIVITGGHTGIGLELSNKLLGEGHELALVVRSESRAEETKRQLSKPENVTFFYGDLSVQSDVKAVAEQISGHWSVIDGLFNNAGVLLDKNYYSKQDNEMHLEVNVLAPYVLTRALADNLKQAKAPFVVSTGTGGMHNQKALNLSMLIKPEKFIKLMGAYYQSKLAMMVLMNRIAKDLQGVRALTVDPGALKTKMTADADAIPFFIKLIRSFVFQPPAKGAEKLYNGAFSDAFRGQTAQYISGNKVKKTKISVTEKEVMSVLAGIK